MLSQSERHKPPQGHDTQREVRTLLFIGWRLICLFVFKGAVTQQQHHQQQQQQPVFSLKRTAKRDDAQTDEA